MKRHTHRSNPILFALLGAGFAAGVAQAGEESEHWQVSGRIAAEARSFAGSAAFPGQSDGAEASLLIGPELDRSSEDGARQWRFVPFLRLDGRDGERTHFDLREAYWRASWSRWQLTAGFNRVFWGVTESRHLVDVINQTDLVEDPDGEDKLGQPMIQLATDRGFGRVEGFALVGFRERTFPGPDGRLRAPLPVDGDAATYESGAGRWRVDGAIRWSHYFGDWDVGAHVFNGTSREPTFAPDDLGDKLVPRYAVIRQAGVDVQNTRGAWLLKLEALARAGQGKTFGASVVGFEYTFYQVKGSSIDVGLLAEYLYDGRDAAAPPTIYDDDVFVGTRVAFNDPFGTQLLGGVIVDRHDRSMAGFLEAARRVGSRMKLEMEARWFTNVAPENGLQPFERDSHVTLRVSRYF